MKRIFTLLVALVFFVGAWGQVTILSEDFTDGSLPSGWAQTDVTFTTSAGGYANFTMTSATLTSPVINLSTYTNVTLTFDVAKFGSGSDGPLTVQISNDGGATWTAQTFNSPTPTSTTYLTSGPTVITVTGSNVRIRFIRVNSFSAKRFRNFELKGELSSTYDNESDIIEGGFDEPDNIAYESYSASNGLTTANAIKIGTFIIRDGGATGPDADMVSTSLIGIGFSVLNPSNIAALAIFDGTTNISEISSVTATTVFNNINSGAGLEAADNNMKSFDVYATFKSTVADNEQVQLTVISATADNINGSVFAEVDAGGAFTSIIGDDNRIEVMATDLIFDQEPTNVNLNIVMFPSPTVLAVDANVNIDADFTGLIVLSTTGVFNGMSTTSTSAIDGIATFSNLIFATIASNITISGTSTGVNSTGNSLPFSVIDLPKIVINELLPDPDSDVNGDGSFDASGDEFIEIYNNGSATVDLAGWTISDEFGIRHTFPSGTILDPGIGLVVFGGGSPTGIPTIAQVATGGLLGFNNGGDNISLVDNNFNVIDTYGYGSSINNVSYGRAPDFTGPFVAHTSITGNYSPGRNNASGAALLPINLLTFTAKAQKENILLQWQTATEINNDYMAVERSQDGRNYLEIGRVQGMGTTQETQSYHFEDENPWRGTNFYRLRQVDFDGQMEYHKVVAVNFAGHLEEGDLQVYPTIVQDVLTVTYDAEWAAEASLQIVGLDGRVWKQQSGVDFQNGDWEVTDLPRGMYLLQLQDGARLVTKRFVKQ